MQYSVSHNLYDVIGSSLYKGLETGEIDTQEALDMINASIDLDLGSGYGINLGYNKPMTEPQYQHTPKHARHIPPAYMPHDERRGNLKLTISKRF